MTRIGPVDAVVRALLMAGSLAAVIPVVTVAAKNAPIVKSGPASGAHLRDFTGRWLYRNSFPDDPINNHVIEGVRATCESTCIWFGRASTGGVVRDVELTRASPAVSARTIDAGIRIGGSKAGVATTGVLIERVYSHGWRQLPHDGYMNGDGMTINRDAGTVTVRDSRFEDNSDGGVDTKGDMTVLEGVTSANNGHYGFRLWSNVRAMTLTCTNNAWGCIEAESGARVVIDRLVMVGPQELVTTKPGAVVEIRSCDLSSWTGTAATRGPGRVILGAGCQRRS